MKTLLYNISYPTRVMRRYMCSYNVLASLFPPHELLSLGGIVKEWKKGEVYMLDAVAENKTVRQSLDFIGKLRPDLIVSMVGLEFFEYDLKVLDRIKETYPETTIACIGYYPTVFPRETLSHSRIDFIICGEPELAFSELYDAIADGGLRNDESRVRNPQCERIEDLDALPFPAMSLIDKRLYNEIGFPKPFATVLTARGCPFPCNYCVRTYGRKLYLRSADSIMEELRSLKQQGFKSIRFLDDTFNLNKERVRTICERMLRERLRFRWSCLSRVDTVDEESVKLMRKAGCERIYLGIESGSQKILDYYKKGYTKEEMKEKIAIVSNAGIEAAGFFLVGAPVEMESDLKETIRLAKSSKLDYAIASKLVIYPGTSLYDEAGEHVDFQLMPYTNRFNNEELERRALRWEKLFYRRYYLSPSGLIKFFLLLARHPGPTVQGLFDFLRFISGTERERDRVDLF